MSGAARIANVQLSHLKTGRSEAAVRGVFWSVINTMTPTIVGLLVFVATSRFLGPADFGVVALATGITTIASALAPGGFGQALVQRLEITHDHLDAVFWVATGASIVIYVPFVVFSGLFASMFSTPILTVLVPILAFRVVLDMIALVPNAILLRQMAYKKFAARTAIASLVSAGFCLALLLLNMGFWALALSQLAGSVALCVGSVISAQWLPRLSLKLKPLQDLGRFALLESVNRSVITLALDQIAIGAILGAVALGLFNFGRRTTQLLTDAVSGGLNSVSYTMMASLQNEAAKVREAFLLATFMSSSACFPLFVGLALTADDLVPLAFGDRWTAAIPVVQCFCVLGLLAPIIVLQSSLVKSQGHPHLWLAYDLGKLVANTLYIVLFGSWGVNALALALLVSNYAMWLPSVFIVSRLLQVSIFSYLYSFARPALATLVMLSVVIAVKDHMADASPLLRLVTTVATGAAIYPLTLAVLASGDLRRAIGIVTKRQPAVP